MEPFKSARTYTGQLERTRRLRPHTLSASLTETAAAVLIAEGILASAYKVERYSEDKDRRRGRYAARRATDEDSRFYSKTLHKQSDVVALTECG